VLVRINFTEVKVVECENCARNLGFGNWCWSLLGSI